MASSSACCSTRTRRCKWALAILFLVGFGLYSNCWYWIRQRRAKDAAWAAGRGDLKRKAFVYVNRTNRTYLLRDASDFVKSALGGKKEEAEKKHDGELRVKPQIDAFLANVPEEPVEGPGLFEPLPKCPNGMRIPSVRTEIKSSRNHTVGVLTKSSTFYSTRWGNVLSPYWAARTMAQLGGYEYRGRSFGPRTWMQHLPTQADATTPKKKLYDRACACRKWEYFHVCQYGWGDIQGTIQKDTRAALKKYAETRPSSEVQAYQFWSGDDWLIYERCCVLCHGAHGFGNIHVYDAIPINTSVTVFTLSPPNIDESEGNELCGQLHMRRDAYPRSRNPQISIVELAPADMWVDFARLVYAPNLLLPSSGTSWGIWSALANNGTVYVVPMVKNMSEPPGGDCNALSVPVLYDKFQVNISDIKTPEGKMKVLEWFMDDVPLDGLELVPPPKGNSTERKY